jgi:hypothetical protein
MQPFQPTDTTITTNRFNHPSQQINHPTNSTVRQNKIILFKYGGEEIKRGKKINFWGPVKFVAVVEPSILVKGGINSPAG